VFRHKCYLGSGTGPSHTIPRILPPLQGNRNRVQARCGLKWRALESLLMVGNGRWCSDRGGSWTGLLRAYPAAGLGLLDSWGLRVGGNEVTRARGREKQAGGDINECVSWRVAITHAMRWAELAEVMSWRIHLDLSHQAMMMTGARCLVSQAVAANGTLVEPWG
jgi:hypothetical protein